jgi:5-methyltetrahydropteroyltriglutamate--homocysteine methyltransferase
MHRSTERILTTHAGSLPRPEDLRDMRIAKDEGQPYDQAAFARRVRSTVAEVVQQQIASGIDIINDGEVSKRRFSTYVRERFSGCEERPPQPDERPAMISGRDLPAFAEYFAGRGGFGGASANARQVFCTGPLRYVGHAAVPADLENFKAALASVPVEETVLPAIAPGTIEHGLRNRSYPNDEAYLYAIADAMREEYQAIVAAGFLLQIDDPDLADGWQIHPQLSVPESRQFAELRVEALNHALRDIPPERVRLHVGWGSYHGSHTYEISLKDLVDLILKVRVEGSSIEASNPRHAHEWRVWEDVKRPAGKVLIPGVVGHATDFMEHPELVADRLVRYARLVGRENVIAGTDCGLGGRVGHPKIVWAKFEALAEGAQLATQQRWHR